MIYLASPYSASPQANFELTEAFVAEALRSGHPIFSPVVHCHQIALDYNLPGDFEFWKNFNFNMLRAADELWVLTLPGWKESKGVDGEVDFARSLGIPIIYINQHYQLTSVDIESIKMQPIDEHTIETFGPTDITSTLAERGSRYGDFAGHARITQSLKSIMWNTPKWDTLSPAQMESLEMIVHKIGRILNGDPNYHDSWHDIEGYARLVSETLEHE